MEKIPVHIRIMFGLITACIFMQVRDIILPHVSALKIANNQIVLLLFVRECAGSTEEERTHSSPIFGFEDRCEEDERTGKAYRCIAEEGRRWNTRHRYIVLFWSNIHGELAEAEIGVLQ